MDYAVGVCLGDPVPLPFLGSVNYLATEKPAVERKHDPDAFWRGESQNLFCCQLDFGFEHGFLLLAGFFLHVKRNAHGIFYFAVDVVGGDYVVSPDCFAYFAVIVVAGVFHVFSRFVVDGVVEEEVADATLGSAQCLVGYG